MGLDRQSEAKATADDPRAAAAARAEVLVRELGITPEDAGHLARQEREDLEEHLAATGVVAARDLPNTTDS